MTRLTAGEGYTSVEARSKWGGMRFAAEHADGLSGASLTAECNVLGQDRIVGVAEIRGRAAAPALSRRKRCLDIVGALFALLLFLPLLTLIAMAIRLESPGPIIFRQRRGGLNGRPFTIFKFRTMQVLDDGDEIQQARRGDPRITQVGRLLRRTSMDELPQLLNILKGDMSLVGPRPHALAHDRYYGQRIANYAERLRTRPGLTGLAQVCGLRGETREVREMAERIEYDLRYIDEWSMALDLKLIAGTAQALRSQRAL